MKNMHKLMENLAENQSKVDADAVRFYSGLVDKNGMDTLFPDLSNGCINFGYWESIPKKISKSVRLQSQIRLYQKTISYLSTSKSQSILEVGCGRGHGVQMLLNKGIDAFGVDAVSSQVDLCRKNYPNETDKFIQGYAGSLPFQKENFHGIISLEAAQHFPNFRNFAKEAYRVLKTSGSLIISTFFYTGFYRNPLIHDILPENVLGSHHAIGIKHANEILTDVGFSKISTTSIGENVFEGFCAWAKQEKPDTKHSSRWVKAFKSGLIDYYILEYSK